MLKKITLLCCMLLQLIMFAGAAKNDNIFISNKQNQFSITMDENKSTGFAIFLNKYDSNLVKPIAKATINNDKQEKIIGQASKTEWTFDISSVKVPTLLTISFVNTRPTTNDQTINYSYNIFVDR